ncbi:MAG: SRPBCC family protein [Bacteroidota bacterium]
MKALKYILFVLLILIIGLAIYIAVQPNSFDFKRSRIVEAPAPVVFNLVNDYKAWPRFSPWMEQEKDANLTYGDKTSGEGASYSWEGEILGKGNMQTESVVSNESIEQDINFIEPFESSSDIKWTFEPSEKGTKVTWAMSGKQDFMTKMYVAFAGPIEKTTGPDFERGLFKLDSIATADMKKYEINVEGVTQHSGGYYIYSSTSAKMDDFKVKLAELMPKVGGFASANNITVAGNPFVIYHKWDVENNAVIFSCCIPTTTQVITSEGDILTGQLKPFKAVKTILKGDYEYLRKAWEKAMDYVKTNDLNEPETGISIESYVSDPMMIPNPANWLTEIYLEVE